MVTFSKCSRSKQSELWQKIIRIAVSEKKLKKSFLDFYSFARIPENVGLTRDAL